jgi:thiopeptide-type bacteriocin biosynthesis protein
MRSRRPFEPAGFFLMRSPLLPAELLDAGPLSSARAFREKADPAGAEARYRADVERVRARVRTLLEDPVILEALQLASPALVESLPSWRAAPDSERGRKVEASLYRYLSRAITRPTPFGLFAGISLGTSGAATRLELAPRTAHRRRSRLDMDAAFALAKAVAANPAHQPRLRFAPNSSLYRIGDRLRYVEADREGDKRRYRLVGVEASEPIDLVLAGARDGATLPALAEALCASDAEISREDADGFVRELVEVQLLVPELEPALTDERPIETLIAKLRAAGASGEADLLASIQDQIAAIDRAGPGCPPRVLEELSARVQALPGMAERGEVLQVDLVKPFADGRLSRQVLDDAIAGAELLIRLGGQLTAVLAHFRRRFVERYEQREVPLTELLDPEVGLPFGTVRDLAELGAPLLQGLGLSFGEKADPPMASPARPMLFERLLEALRTGAHEIALTEAELAPLRDRPMPPVGPGVLACISIAARSPQALDAGDYQLVCEYAGGPSAAPVLARFCHADEELLARVRGQVAAEQARLTEPCIEVLFVPEERIGNVSLRPRLHARELAYLARGSASGDERIGLDDLRVSVREGRFVLRSARLGRELRTRIDSAQNYAEIGLPLYRFLALLQLQDHAQGTPFSWGELSGSPFLPRLRAGRVVLARASWALPPGCGEELAQLEGSARFLAAQELRTQLGLPRFVVIGGTDRRLVMDFDNPLSVDAAVGALRQASRVGELYPAPDELVAHGPEGHFFHEVLVPLLRTSSANGPRQVVAWSNRARSFVPGSEWLSAKIYCGQLTAERLLGELAPLIQEARRGLADRWFFLRYQDPDPHLRVRLHGAPEQLWGEWLPRLQQTLAPWLARGEVARVQLDTYERELERYGGPDAIENVEAIFEADSEAALALLELQTDQRWRAALLGMHRLLDDFGFGLDDRLALARARRHDFATELGTGRSQEDVLSARFRRERAGLEALLFSGSELTRRLDPVFARRSQEVRAPIAGLTGLTVSRESLASSVLHMHVNRVLATVQRPQEFVLFDFLARLYGSRRARKAAAAPG